MRRLTRTNVPAAIAGAAALAAFAVGIRWGTNAAGGSDSSCYLNEARLFASGTTHIDQPLVDQAPWPRAEWTFTPAGHLPSPARRDVIVPMCPPGLPLTMAAARLARLTPFAIVPLSGALAVWLAFVLGRRIDSPAAGAAAAALFASSPIFLFQVVQPMTDVPAAMGWLLAVVLAPHPLGAGLATSMAVLTRPNLAPLAGVLAVYVARDARRAGLWRFAVGVAPGLVALALLQKAMYGSPLATGYGAPGDLFQAANIGPNAARYARWLLETQTPVVVLALAAPFVVRRRDLAWTALAMAALTAALYLPYRVFDDWWYLRFLLPAVALLIVLTVATVAAACRRIAPRAATPIVAAIAAVMVIAAIATARSRQVLAVQAFERSYVDAGSFAAERLPRTAAVLTVRHSGAVHYASQLPIVSWDTLPPESLDTALAFLRSHGLTPVFLLDAAEESDFRARFGKGSLAGQLDWPPIARIGRTVRAYDPADRARYLAGARIETIDWPPAPRRH